MHRNVLVFDFFGVICSEIAPDWFRRYFPPEVALRLKKEIVSPADTGEISEQDLFTQLGLLINSNPGQVQQEWLELVHIDASVVELLTELAPRFRLALLTNSPAPFVRRIMRTHELESRFEQIIVSSEQGIAKPDTQVFRLMLSRLGIGPEHAVMIDDNPANVAAAASVGMTGLLFTSAQQLRQAVLDLESV